MSIDYNYRRFSSNRNTSLLSNNRNSEGNISDRDLNPNFIKIKTQTGKDKVVRSGSNIDGVANPKFQKNTRLYMDSDYGSSKRKHKRYVEITGNISHVYTQALLSMFKRKKMHNRILSKGKPIITPSELLAANKDAPLTMMVKVASRESMEDTLDDMMSAPQDCKKILSISGMCRDESGFDELLLTAESSGVEVVIGKDDLIRVMDGYL